MYDQKVELEHKKILLLEVKRVSKLSNGKIAEFILKNLNFNTATGISYDSVCNELVKKIKKFAKSTIDESSSGLLAFKLTTLIKIVFDSDKSYNLY